MTGDPQSRRAIFVMALTGDFPLVRRVMRALRGRTRTRDAGETGLPQAARIKRIVILANSRKLRGRCVAGREWRDGKAGAWIRPISARDDHAVSERERLYGDGTEPRLLDVVDIPLLKPLPMGHQRENWLLESKRHWKRVGTVSWDSVYRLCDPATPLWIDGDSTYYGRNDRVHLDQSRTLTHSLRFIHVNRLRLSVFTTNGRFGTRRRVQGRFRHKGNDYWLWVTHPEYEDFYLAKPDCTYDLGESFLTISLGGPSHQDACYKLIAAIIQSDSLRGSTPGA